MNLSAVLSFLFGFGVLIIRSLWGHLSLALGLPEVRKSDLLLEILRAPDEKQGSGNRYVLRPLHEHRRRGEFRVEGEADPKRNADDSDEFWEEVFAEDGDEWDCKAESDYFREVNPEEFSVGVAEAEGLYVHRQHFPEGFAGVSAEEELIGEETEVTTEEQFGYH